VNLKIQSLDGLFLLSRECNDSNSVDSIFPVEPSLIVSTRWHEQIRTLVDIRIGAQSALRVIV
jgi:hypothetical protein